MTVTKETQEVIVSALIKSSYLFSIGKSEMSDGYFSDPSCKVIYKALSMYYDKYSTTPSLNELLITIDDCYYPQVGVALSEVKDVCCKIYDYDEPDEEFIKDKITDFIRKVRSSSALKNFVNQIKLNPNLESDSVVSELAKALEVQLSTTKVFMMNNADQVKEARESAVGSTDQSKVIKSFINSLNQNLMFGGYQPGTVNMIVAPPGCFTGDTEVITSEGVYTIEELYNSSNNSYKLYGCDPSRLSIANTSYESIYLSEYTTDIISIEVDNTCKIKCTRDHPFLLKTGIYCKAEELSIGDRLMTIDTAGIKICSSQVTNIEYPKLKEEVPVYGIVGAIPYNNYTLRISDNLGVVVSNTGKSMFLINEGVSAAKQGFDVLHIFIGDMVEYDGFIRYLSCISGTPQNSLVMMPIDKQQSIVKLCNEQYNDIFNRLYILAYPSLSITVDNMIEDINKFEKSLNKDFGMIIVDYPDNLILEGNSLYTDGGTLYSSLERLSRLTKSVVLVASQPQKSYWNHSIIPLEAASESSKKQMAVDIMLTMNTESRGANFGTMLLAKARKGEVGKIFRFKTEYAKCGIEEIDEGTYNAFKATNKN